MARTMTATQVVARRILGELEGLVTRLGALYREHVPEYAALSEADMAHDVLPVSRQAVTLFFEAIADQREPDVADMPELRAMGRRRLEMGVPLEPMLHVYRIFGRAVWEAVVAAIRPGEADVLADLGGRWMDYVDRASSVAASGYLEASHERIRRLDARRGAVLDALLAVRDPSEVAALSAQFSTSFADRYVPVLVRADDVASRIDAVVQVSVPGTLAGFRGTDLLLLAPMDTPDVRAVAAEVDGGRVAHGHPSAPGPDLARELTYTERLLEAAERADGPRLVGPDDLLLEQLLAASPRTASTLERRISRRLRAADRSGAVVATLSAYLGCGSVPRTAAAVGVHANTVSYRLRRVAEITGYDPRVPAEAAVLALAVRARSVDPTGSGPGNS